MVGLPWEEIPVVVSAIKKLALLFRWPCTFIKPKEIWRFFERIVRLVDHEG